MFESDIDNIKGILIRPVQTFKHLKESSLTDSYRYYVFLLIGYVILVGIISIITAYFNFYGFLLQIASIPLLGPQLLPRLLVLKGLIINWQIFLVYLWFLLLLGIVFIKGSFLHLFVILLGGENGLSRTIQALMYAFTPFFFMGWIPYLSIIGVLWSFVLFIIGVMIFQELPGWKATLTLLIPIILGVTGLVLCFILILDTITAFTGMY